MKGLLIFTKHVQWPVRVEGSPENNDTSTLHCRLPIPCHLSLLITDPAVHGHSLHIFYPIAVITLQLAGDNVPRVPAQLPSKDCPVRGTSEQRHPCSSSKEKRLESRFGARR